ncbi:MAG: DNA mismatch repair endonuclease MutL [Pseudomonadota bacterium]|nr:DNA mismatch repair endonuclease MutL [Pseudomonadota bacterium]
MKAENQIQILPSQVHNKIAAGEVVARPASVVKELVENALDAGADQISVFVEDGGKQLIEVIDNGCGMGKNDALLALERHATSKIVSEKDLFALKTFGFRGEALPSIAAVSRFILETRIRKVHEAVCITMDDDHHLQVDTTGAPVGTRVRVRDLFYNIPARQKFVKTTVTERGAILDCLNRFSLVHPDCGFTLIHNQKNVFKRTAGSDLRHRLMEVLGRETGEELLPVSGGSSTAGVLSGFTSPPILHRSNRRSIYLFVNNRMVKDQVMNSAVLKAYQGLMEKGRYPVSVLFLTIDPSLVDMNVHPAKEEVKFAEPGRIFSLIRQAILEALSGYPGSKTNGSMGNDPFAALISSSSDHEKAGSSAGVAATGARQPDMLPDWQPGAVKTAENVASGAVHEQPRQYMPETDNEMPRGKNFFSAMEIIGQVWKSYLVLSHGDALYMIDQHAAHERILFDQLQQQMGTINGSQELLLPITMDLSPDELAAVDENSETLNRLGFTLAPFGNYAVVLTGIPVLAKDYDPRQFFSEVIGDLLQSSNQSIKNLPLIDELAAGMACRLAIKASDALSHEEIVLLLMKLDQVNVGQTCPHGRPLYFSMSRYEMEKRFQRR